MNDDLYERGKAIIQAAPQLYVDLDVEADGKPGYGSLLSIGAVTPGGDNFYRELKPTSELYVPTQREFCEAHGLERARLLDEGMEPAQAVAELIDWTRENQQRYRKVGSVLVAFNASFDYPWIDLEAAKAGLESPFGVAGYCIKSLAQILAPGYDWSKTSKSKLPPEIVPPGDFTHNALEDAIYQQALHYAMVGKIDKLLGPNSPWRKT